MRYFLQRITGFILLSSFLSGCINMQAPPAANHFKYTSPKKRQQQLQAFSQWQCNGALSIQKDGKAYFANFNWKLNAKTQYRLQISSALSLYNMIINADDQQVFLLQSGKTPKSAATPEALMTQVMGYSLPITNLYYWIRSLAAPGSATLGFDHYGHLQSLQQQSWKLDFLQYTHLNGIDLPQLIDIENPKLKIRIVIKHWQKL